MLSRRLDLIHLMRMIATIFFAEAKIWVTSIVLELDTDMSNPADRFGYDTDMGACILSLADSQAYS